MESDRLFKANLYQRLKKQLNYFVIFTVTCTGNNIFYPFPFIAPRLEVQVDQHGAQICYLDKF